MKLSHPWRSALATFAAVTIATGPAGMVGVFATILSGSQARISDCVKRESRETCEKANQWDSVSFVNLFAATWGGFLIAGPILGIVAGTCSFRAAQPRIARQIPPSLQNRLSGAIDNGLNLEKLLDAAGYQK